tara:strand:+ start:257 stop:517 length:261 start_codon:yes stop_codon:yes gene_type:complete
MDELTNKELSELMNDEKMYKHQPSQSGESDCCGAPVVDDYELCSECKDHCERLSTCGFCGEETEKDFCSDNCWNGYKSETFDEKNK